jgi:hypothetical protein
MVKLVSALMFSLLLCQPVLAQDPRAASRDRATYLSYLYSMSPPRHVVEVVAPPYSARFIINGARFTGVTPACFSWAAGERIKLIAGDWNGRCAGAVFYNFAQRNRCEMWCGW